MGGVAPVSEFKNHTPRVLQKHGATKSLGLDVGFGTSYDVFQHWDLEFHFQIWLHIGSLVGDMTIGTMSSSNVWYNKARRCLPTTCCEHVLGTKSSGLAIEA
ncbi:unnamed protein product [Prunus armeniaca]